MSQPPTESTIADENLSRQASVGIWLYGLTLLLIDLGPGWVLTYHENLFAGGAREFLREGNWLIPRYLGRPLFEYPPLTQWLIALSMTIFRSDAEWVARLPIGLAAVLNAWLIARLATRWLGGRIGLVAGLVQLTTYYSLMQGRLAESDMIVAVTVTAAMSCFAFGVIDRSEGSRRPFWLTLGYFGATALSFLAKGPIGPAFIALGSLGYALIDRRRAVWRFLIDPAGWVLMLSVILGWVGAMLRYDPRTLAMMRENTLDRFSQGQAMHTDGRENPFFYLYMVPLLMLPWTLLLAKGLTRGTDESPRPRAFRRFLACWFVAGLVLLSCSAFKHKHYVIPVLPPLSIIAAVGLVRHARGHRPGTRAPWVAAVAGIVAALALVVVSRFAPGKAHVLLWVSSLAVIVGLGLAGSLAMRRRGQADRSLASLFGAIWLVVLIVRSTILPSFDDYRGEAALARLVNDRVKPGVPIYLVNAKLSQLTYYLRPPLARRDNLAEFINEIALKSSDETTYALVPEADLGEIAGLGKVEILGRSTKYKHVTIVEIHPKGSEIASKGVESPR